jgi:hypothetical protein
MTAVKRNPASDEVRFLKEYEMDLARGSSHIASMLYPESIHVAVKETVLLFEARHGRDDLKTFLHALIKKLEQRGKPEAVKVLQDFIKRGRSPGIGEPGATPLDTRQSRAQKPQGTPSQKAKARATADPAQKKRRG